MPVSHSDFQIRYESISLTWYMDIKKSSSFVLHRFETNLRHCLLQLGAEEAFAFQEHLVADTARCHGKVSHSAFTLRSALEDFVVNILNFASLRV